MYIESQTMSQAFYRSATQSAHRAAQLFNPDLYPGETAEEISWTELLRRVEAMSSGLISLGLEKGDRIAIMAANSPYWTHADIATINCGGVLVTIYPTLSLHEASYIINDSASKMLFVGNEQILARIVPGLNQLPTVQKVIVLRSDYQSNDPRILSMADLMALGEKDWPKNEPVYESRWKNNQLDDWATILYTSGTTGQGKGVILTHRSMQQRMDGSLEYFSQVGHPLSESDVGLSFLPLSHIFDRACTQWAAIYVGCALAYADSTATILADMQKYNPTWFSCVPRLYEKIYMQFNMILSSNPTRKKIFDWAMRVGEKALAYRTDPEGYIDMRPIVDLKSRLPMGLRMQFMLADKLFAKVRELFGSRYRFSFSASAGIAPDLLRFFYVAGLPVLEGYGLTETCSAVTYNPMFGAKPGTIGPEANRSIARMAPDGELEISGAGLFIGYLNKPEDTAAAFTEDGWFRTGDLVLKDERGYYRIIDRKKAIICLAVGKNVAPAKIESLFATSIAVEQVFVIGDERTFITALIVPNYNYFIELFDKQGIPYDKSRLVYSNATGAPICVEVGEDFTAQPVLCEMVAEAVAQANQQLEEFETVKQYEIITRRFTEDNDELTPTQKTKKRVILEHYKDSIEEMYLRKKC